MSKSTRLKAQPIKTRAEFDDQVFAVLTLEALRRRINAERDAELIAVNKKFDERLAPVETEIKGRMALTRDYADDHATELLPTKTARSFKTTTAQIGWKTGNPAVETKSGVTVEHAVNALEALGLEAYVRIEKKINKAGILNDCKDGKTLLRVVRDETGAVVMEGEQPKTEPVLIGDAGLKITQGESFYIDPLSADAETLKPAAAA